MVPASQSCWMCKWLLYAWFCYKKTRYIQEYPFPVRALSEFNHHMFLSPFLNGNKSRQEAVGTLELVTCGGEGEEGAQLWVPLEQLGALGWLAAPSSWGRRTSCMAGRPCVGDGRATCPRHWAPGVQIGVG